MPDISSIGHGPPEPLNRAASLAAFRENGFVEGEHGDRTPADRVELSDHARFLDRIRQFPEVRTDRIENVRQAIADGTYETDEVLEIVIDRLAEELIV
ncbi:MAG: flagellar biosynthesis anti-sigma factor FlgM [Phycisphaerales bacterium]|nr:MAG: flagellar biosynthesis anti-sigma factor FlgM [Phycisphaerales bacterium]